jgi:hypothetical protein
MVLWQQQQIDILRYMYTVYCGCELLEFFLHRFINLFLIASNFILTVQKKLEINWEKYTTTVLAR